MREKPARGKAQRRVVPANPAPYTQAMYKVYHRRRIRTLLIPLALVAATYVGIGLRIGHDVRRIAAGAAVRYPGDMVASLAACAADEAAPAARRTEAVWALGQLGDPAALPLLERLHAHAAFRDEVRKAIRGCRGNFNVTAAIWRRSLDRT
jgi:hypothetical protein